MNKGSETSVQTAGQYGATNHWSGGQQGQFRSDVRQGKEIKSHGWTSFLTEPRHWSFIPFKQRKGIRMKQDNRVTLSSAGVWSDLSGRRGEAVGGPKWERFSASRPYTTKFVLIHSPPPPSPNRTANLAGCEEGWTAEKSNSSQSFRHAFGSFFTLRQQ
jgi:hypothetical protein